MSTSEGRQTGCEGCESCPAISLKSLGEGIVRRLRNWLAKSLNFLARVCDAKVPHTPYALPARQSAARAALGWGLVDPDSKPRSKRAVVAWPAPRCPVCGERIGRTAQLDVLDARRGGRFRLTCSRVDNAHMYDVVESFRLKAHGNPDAQLRRIAELDWVDPKRIGAATIKWLFAHCRIGWTER